MFFPARTVKGMRVLICDDEARIQQHYRIEFELGGAEVVCANDGHDCLYGADREHPDLIVLDLRMPRMDGLATLPQISQHQPGVAVVVVSGEEASKFDQATARGAVDCVDKLEFLLRIPPVIARYGGAVAPTAH